MTPEERLTRIEQQTEMNTAGIRDLIVVSRTCLDSIQELTDSLQGLTDSLQELKKLQTRDHEQWVERDMATNEKLNILIETLDRIIRRRNGQE